MNHPRTLSKILLLLSFFFCGSASASPQGDGRVIVLGFDGADARTVRELMAAEPDAYPNFRRLQEQGTFESLVVEAPPESPVSWAALNTGQNPAKTGVPGFVRRENTSRGPFPGLGHLGDEEKPLEELENAPIPTLSPTVFAAVAGAGAFAVVFVLLILLLRGRFAIAAVFALLFGAGGAWAGHTVRSMLPETYPRATNPNKARNFWDYAAEGGAEVVVLDAAQAFDHDVPRRGPRCSPASACPTPAAAIGDWFIYTTDPEADRPRAARAATRPPPG